MTCYTIYYIDGWGASRQWSTSTESKGKALEKFRLKLGSFDPVAIKKFKEEKK